MSKETADQKPKQPPAQPEHGPKGPRTPYPVDEPPDPRGPGSDPDYFPDKPAGGDLPKMLGDSSFRIAAKRQVGNP